MQILSISGENIASLAKPFEIRLDTPPLSGAGLIAITGETGAGKSSLLDAMCLALYGNCPRLSGDGTSEAVTDIGGQELKSTDARMVLRRGVAYGFAEVTFRARDGATYTAGWKARRARDRIDGRLQNIERSLVRASDGQVLETQTLRVNERVVALTGLTYDEFRRTVLLAQGDFDAFLGARTQERAAILEKVTGTGIYRDISRRVFERNRTAAAALATLETRRGEHHLLAPEARTEIAASIAGLRAAQSTEEKELEAVQKDLARYTAIEKSENDLATAKARVTAAEARIATLARERHWLADWDRAQTLRGELRELREAGRALDEARKTHARIAQDHTARQSQAASAEARFEAADTARDAAERVFKDFGPIWDEAAALDNRIVGATEEHAKAAAALTESKEAEVARQASLDALVARETALRKTVAAAERSMAAVEGHAALLSNWGVIEERLGARIEQAGLALASEKSAAEIAAAIAGDQTRRQTLETEIEAASGKIEAARQGQEEIEAARKGLTEAAPATRLDRLLQAQADLRELRQAAGEVRTADRALADSQGRHRAAAQKLAEQRHARKDARARQAAAANTVEALRQPTGAAEAAASREAAHLRQHLEDGTPCPVCGATTHPVMKDRAIAELAQDLRHRLTAAQAARDAAEAEATTADLHIAAAQDIIDTETADAPGLKARIDAAEAAFADARAPLLDGPLANHLPDGPRAADDAFEALHRRLAGWRTALEAEVHRRAELDRQHREADKVIAQEKGKITTCEGEIRRIGAQISARESDIVRLVQAGEGAGATIADIDRKLDPLLAPTTLAVKDFGPDAGEKLDQLRAQVESLANAAATVQSTRDDLADLATALAEARATLSGAQTMRDRAQATETARREVVAHLRDTRAALLGGEDTGTHRTRHNDARMAAQTAFDAAQRALSDATRAEAAAQSALGAAQDAESKAADRAEAARTALAAARAAAGLEEEQLRALIEAEPAKAAACRQALADADTEKTAAEGARQERAQEHAALTAEGLPETAKDALETRKATLEAAARMRGETLGRLSQQLDADTAAAKALAGLEAEIDAARKTAETWTAVNAAVGSAKGDRFAQIAQAVTLALLVERANLHLDDLKPRYQLQVAPSDLALHVIDRDMADDARPTRLLSGGERFLVSLALALALSGMGTRGVLAGTLFIDEGFGSLDSDSLDLALDALERLQAQGRTIGVISHVQAMKDRIPVQLQVHKTGGGASEVDLVMR